MSQPSSEHNALAAKISTVVEAYLPTQFERSAAHKQLQQRISAVLAESPLLASADPDSRSELAPKNSAESCTVTILLADIRGFATLAETYSAKMLMNLLNRFYGLMGEVVQRYGGYIDRPMGDAMRVLFGVNQAKANDVECALACAIAMQHAMNDYNQQNKELGFPELFMGVGINTGTVLAGDFGSDQQQRHTVIGDAVDLVSRIEAQSLRGQILMSEATFKLAQSYTLVGQSNSVHVKGRRKPVLLYELLGTTQPRTMTVPRREIRKSPRVAVNMPCYFQVVKGKEIKSQHCKAEVIDIGYHGFLILSPVPLEHFSEIKLEVSLNLLAADTRELYARVLHCESIGQGFRCSLEFTTMDLAGQQCIKRFVDNMISG